MSWLRRKQEESLDPQVLLAKTRSEVPATGFRFTVEDVFSIKGRGTVVTGQVAAGRLAKGATVRLVRADGTQRDVTVTGIEAFRKTLDVAEPGPNVGLLLRDVGRDDVARGDQLLG
jgi:elongation factor Tu